MRKGNRRLSPWIGRSLLLCILLAVILSPYIFIQIAIPDTLRVIDGGSWGQDGWSSGVFQLEAEENQWVTVNDTTIRKNSRIETGEIAETQGVIRLFGLIPLKSVSLEVWPEKMLQAGGSMVGLDLYTDGILVLGTGKVETAQGEQSSPAKGLLQAGDRIRRVNGQEVSTVEQVDALISQGGENPVQLQITRGDETITVSVMPLADRDGTARIGVWIRDRAQGLGTLTFADPESGIFGAVGHGISDVDTGEILPIQDGLLTQAKIRQLVKGAEGEPGEVEGSLTGSIWGQIRVNTDCGVYGRYNEAAKLSGAYPIALRSQVKNGSAVILSDILGGDVESYSVEIEKASGLPTFDTGLVVTVTDERLLQATGGIIQGMSGCPIIQNGRIVGAVTHVFVKDPTRGYGIYIEDMLEAARAVS